MIVEPTDSPRLRVNDVIVRGRKRYLVLGVTPRGKLRLQGRDTKTGREHKTEKSTWWTYVSSPPRKSRVYRDGRRIR